MKYDVSGIRSRWAEFTYVPEYVEHKHQDCSDEKAMQIFNREMTAQPIIESSHVPVPLGKCTCYNIDLEAMILAGICVFSTLIVSIVI
ncbi:MAG: hypothetical protein GX465_16960 [Acidobacteria bacterium]|nr:hypothetical protein [Acidobacteriota bacterium]